MFDVDITNHYPIFVKLIVLCKLGKVCKSFRDHSARSLESLRNDLDVTLSGDLYSDKIENEHFRGRLFELEDRNCPLRVKVLSYY